jgi:hypothetical protein
MILFLFGGYGVFCLKIYQNNFFNVFLYEANIKIIKKKKTLENHKFDVFLKALLSTAEATYFQIWRNLGVLWAPQIKGWFHYCLCSLFKDCHQNVLDFDLPFSLLLENM